MTLETDSRRRKSIRLKEYDYASAGAYFVTICTHDRKCLFGTVTDEKIVLNDTGRIVESEWLQTAEIRDNVFTDAYIVMPNHFHGILFIEEPNDGRGTVHRAPTVEQFGKPTSNSIPTIIRSFKATVTKQINEFRQTPGQKVLLRLSTSAVSALSFASSASLICWSRGFSFSSARSSSLKKNG